MHTIGNDVSHHCTVPGRLPRCLASLDVWCLGTSRRKIISVFEDELWAGTVIAFPDFLAEEYAQNSADDSRATERQCGGHTERSLCDTYDTILAVQET